MSRSVVGIDPGVSGAVAIVTGGRLLIIEDLPSYDSRCDGAELASILRDYAVGSDIAAVFVENTQPMAKNGSIANYKLGLNTGIVCGVVESLGFPLRRVRPVDWKRSQGLIGKDKNASRGLAMELFPEHRDRFRLVKHHDRAEAALIARYGTFEILKAEAS